MNSTFLPVFSRSISTVAACVLLGATACAQTPAAPAPAGTPGAPAAAPAEKLKPLSAGEQLYLDHTLKSLYFQIQLANAGKGITDMNIGRTRDGAIKDLGKCLEVLGKIATARGVKMPTEVTGTDKVDLDRVTKAKPDKLPKEWATAFAKEAKRLDHETEVTGKTAQDPDLKTFITNYGPSIRATYTAVAGIEKSQSQKKTK
jgi:hypothetical protein